MSKGSAVRKQSRSGPQQQVMTPGCDGLRGGVLQGEATGRPRGRVTRAEPGGRDDERDG